MILLFLSEIIFYLFYFSYNYFFTTNKVLYGTAKLKPAWDLLNLFVMITIFRYNYEYLST